MFNDNMSKVNILLKLVSIQFKYYKEINWAILYCVTMTKSLIKATNNNVKSILTKKVIKAT